jgi:DNA-binding LacI/PurR family transcriptional regulator
MLCTALISGNHLNAMRVLETLQLASYQMPSDLAQTGCDDTSLSQVPLGAHFLVRLPL